jgi:hypothetical protein
MATYQLEVQEKANWITKLKTKWGVTSAWQVLMILLTFSLAGSSVVFLRKYFFSLIGFDASTDFWLKTVVYILFVFPAYQCLLVMYGTLLGQFKFFWEKEKKMALAVLKLINKSRP